MKAVLRVLWMYLTAFPAQRMLAALGAGLFGIGAMIVLLTREAPAADRAMGIVSVLTLGVAFVLVPALISIGGVHRMLSAPATTRLLPHFRGRMLVALMSFVGLFGLASSSALLLSADGLTPAGAVATSLFLSSTFVLCVFTVSGSLRRVAALILLVFAPVWLGVDAHVWTEVRNANALLWTGLGTVLAWLAFGGWYLRARRIRPLDPTLFLTLDPLVFGEGDAKKSTPRSRHPISRTSALSTWFRGALPPSTAAQWISTIGLALIVFVVLGPLNAVGGGSFEALLMLPVALQLLVFLAANESARRARYLWLRIPGPRGEVFRTVERLVLARSARPAAVVVALTALVAALAARWAYAGVAIALLILAGGLFATYAGLALVRGGKLPWLIAMLVSIVSQILAVASALNGSFPATSFVGILAFHVAAAAGLRHRATRNWQRVDWLEFRPSRVPSQSIRPG